MRNDKSVYVLDFGNVFSDFNKYGAVYSVEKSICSDINSLKEKLKAFGFNTTILNGHDETQLSKIKRIEPGLNAVILDTIKGKGIDFLEESHTHQFNFFFEPEKYKEVMEKFKE